jgi:putative transport protein
MEFIYTLFGTQSIASALVYMCLAAVTGIFIGKISFRNIRLGIAGVLFTGIAITQAGARIDSNILHFIRDFGLILFVYAIGVDVGPRFFSSFRKEGLQLNGLAALMIFSGLACAYIVYWTTGISPATATGILCGSTFNTPSLGAAQQVIADQHVSQADTLSMAFAMTYPFGVIGVLLAMIIIRLIFRIDIKKETENFNQSMIGENKRLESVIIDVTNPNLYDKTVEYILQVVDKDLVISRIRRNNQFLVAREDTILLEGDVIYGVSEKNRIPNLDIHIGKVQISEKREITGDMAMAHVLITNRKITGKTIEQIGIYRRYEANITRIFRSGNEILPTRNTSIELGDTVRIVGKKDLLLEIKKELGNSVYELAVPNTPAIFLGIFLGIIIGSIPIFIPGLSAPAKLGLAGGPLLVAILLGYKGRIGKMNFYMTPGAMNMIRELGIILFLTSVGLDSGKGFIQTIISGGYQWMIYGVFVTFIPVLLTGIIARIKKLNYLKICGLLAGSCTNPPALEYANSLAAVQAQSTVYATVYPLTMFLRVVLAQIFILSTRKATNR